MSVIGNDNMGQIVNLTKDIFEAEVKNRSGVVLVDFWAEWCGPCKMLGPILEELSNEVDAKICKVNVDQESELAGEFGIRSIPTIIVFKNGEKIDQIVGLRQKEELLEKIKTY